MIVRQAFAFYGEFFYRDAELPICMTTQSGELPIYRKHNREIFTRTFQGGITVGNNCYHVFVLEVHRTLPEKNR